MIKATKIIFSALTGIPIGKDYVDKGYLRRQAQMKSGKAVPDIMGIWNKRNPDRYKGYKNGNLW